MCNINMDSIRNKCKDILLKNISKHQDLLEDIDVNYIIDQIELGVYNLYSDNNSKYKECIRKLSSNIGYGINAPMVVGRLVTGEWKPEDLAGMSHDELYPELIEKEKLKKQLEQEAIDAFKKFKLEHSGGGLITCGKCKSNKVSHIQVQTRSSDESMTLKCTCEDCGNKWSMY